MAKRPSNVKQQQRFNKDKLGYNLSKIKMSYDTTYGLSANENVIASETLYCNNIATSYPTNLSLAAPGYSIIYENDLFPSGYTPNITANDVHVRGTIEAGSISNTLNESELPIYTYQRTSTVEADIPTVDTLRKSYESDMQDYT
jgi:hypothetical protein